MSQRTGGGKEVLTTAGGLAVRWRRWRRWRAARLRSHRSLLRGHACRRQAFAAAEIIAAAALHASCILSRHSRSHARLRAPRSRGRRRGGRGRGAGWAGPGGAPRRHAGDAGGRGGVPQLCPPAQAGAAAGGCAARRAGAAGELEPAAARGAAGGEPSARRASCCCCAATPCAVLGPLRSCAWLCHPPSPNARLVPPPCRAWRLSCGPSCGRCCWACSRPAPRRRSGTQSWGACAGGDSAEQGPSPGSGQPLATHSTSRQPGCCVAACVLHLDCAPAAERCHQAVLLPLLKQT